MPSWKSTAQRIVALIFVSVICATCVNVTIAQNPVGDNKSVADGKYPDEIKLKGIIRRPGFARILLEVAGESIVLPYFAGELEGQPYASVRKGNESDETTSLSIGEVRDNGEVRLVFKSDKSYAPVLVSLNMAYRGQGK